MCERLNRWADIINNKSLNLMSDDELSWINVPKPLNKEEEIFGGEGSFDNYFKTNIDQIHEAYESIETIC